jgi:adenosylcobyric acid synthase
LQLDEEDGVDFAKKRRRALPFDRDTLPTRRLRVAVVAFPHLANATDFDALEGEPDVQVRYVDDARDLASADLLVLPGSKATIADYGWLVASGFGPAIRAHAAARKPLVGICAGMQMLGVSVADPHAVEGGGTCATLGLLALTTILSREKTTRRVRARYEPALLFGVPASRPEFDGYEIHQGVTQRGAPLGPTAVHAFGEDGATSADGMIVGTYVHDFFSNDAFRHIVLAAARSAAGLEPGSASSAWQNEREERLAAWAAHVRTHLDMDFIAGLIGR